MSSWHWVYSRPDGQGRETDGAGGMPTAARTASSDIGEHELGWRILCSRHVQMTLSRGTRRRVWRAFAKAVSLLLRRATAESGLCSLGSSSHPAVLQPEGGPDGRASCLPLASKVAGYRAAGENASAFLVPPQRWTHAPVFAPRPNGPFASGMPGRLLDGVAPVHGAWWPDATTQGDSGIREELPGTSFHPAALDPQRDADGRASCLPLAREVGQRAAGENASNFVVSPLSIHAALALVAAGARGETQRELLAFLGAETPAELDRAAATELVGRLRDLPQTSFACGVWVRGHASLLRPEFMDTAASRYAAVAESANFVGAPEEARQRINAFVSEATKGLITDVLPPGSVTSSTAVVLANALYFKASWALPFDRSRTFFAPFHLPDGTTVRAHFMTRSGFKQQVAVFPRFRALKLPYNNIISAPGFVRNHTPVSPHQAVFFYMLLLLPDGEALKISDLYDKITSTPGFIRNHTPVGEVEVGRFMVPKFKFTFEFEATEDMRKLGVTRAFEGGDFSGMVSGGNGLIVSGVYHKATIEVDEEGTVAAAATAVSMLLCASASPPVDFVADRPFLFAIVEERTGAVMFIGHVMNPVAE